MSNNFYQVLLSTDLETSGTRPWLHGILEIGCIASDINGKEIEVFHEYCNPGDVEYTQEAMKINNISMETIKNARPIREVLLDFIKFMNKYLDDRNNKVAIVGNSFAFDSYFFQYAFDKHVPEHDKKTRWFFRKLDDLKGISRAIFLEIEHMSQLKLGQLLNVPNEEPHSSLGDARQMLHIYRKLTKIAHKRTILADQKMKELEAQKLAV